VTNSVDGAGFVTEIQYYHLFGNYDFSVFGNR